MTKLLLRITLNLVYCDVGGNGKKDYGTTNHQ